MSLPSKPFLGQNFFTTIRTEMAANRGMFAGTDGALSYACIDASFYRLGIFKKTGNVRFTSAASHASAAVRVIGNGQWFDTNYCDAPCSNIPWHGEIIVDGVKEEPKPQHKFGAGKWYFGQTIGRSQKAFKIGESAASKNKSIYNGLYPLSAVIVGKKKAVGLGELHAKYYPATGKIMYGIHRASDIVFVVAEEDWFSGHPNVSLISGIDILTLADRLITMGVDDAVMGDGGTSATLLIDGNLEVVPRDAKDFTMRVGPMFTLQTLKTQLAGSKMTATSISTDAQFPSGTVLLGVSAQFSQTNSGMQLQAFSWGSTGTRTAAQIKLDLELPSVTTLACSGSRLTGATASSFAIFTGPNTTASLRLDPAADSGGRIVGTVTVKTSRGKAVFNVDWTLAP